MDTESKVFKKALNKIPLKLKLAQNVENFEN